MDNCSYSDCALDIRFGFVIHYGRVYSHPVCYRHYRYSFASYQWPESDLSVTNIKGDFLKKRLAYLIQVTER